MATNPKTEEIEATGAAAATPGKQERAVAKAQPTKPAPVTDEITQLIQQALASNVPIETMKELLVMRRELKAERAKEAFDAAMAAFQAECPVIEKKKKVYEKNSTTKVRYSFAPLDDIVEQVKPILGKNGLSYTFKTEQDEKSLGVICIAKHILGHSEETGFSIPIGSEEYMSLVQKFGARVTFAKRYAFCNAFGISTGDEDTDAPEVKKSVLPEADVAKINKTKTYDELVAVCKEITARLKPELRQSVVEEFQRRKVELSDEMNDQAAAALEGQDGKK